MGEMGEAGEMGGGDGGRRLGDTRRAGGQAEPRESELAAPCCRSTTPASHPILSPYPAHPACHRPPPNKQTPSQHLVNIWRDGLAAHPHAPAVYHIPILPEGQPPHHHSLLRRHHCRQAGMGRRGSGGGSGSRGRRCRAGWGEASTWQHCHPAVGLQPGSHPGSHPPTVEAGAGAAQHAGQVIQDGVRVALVLKQLHICRQGRQGVVEQPVVRASCGGRW
jgi:hypothetical protein